MRSGPPKKSIKGRGRISDDAERLSTKTDEVGKSLQRTKRVRRSTQDKTAQIATKPIQLGCTKDPLDSSSPSQAQGPQNDLFGCRVNSEAFPMGNLSEAVR